MQSIAKLSLARLFKEKGQIEAEIISRISKGEFGTRGANGGQSKYQKATPSYRNPKNPGETWVGRGRRPFWLTTALKRGKKLSDFALH